MGIKKSGDAKNRINPFQGESCLIDDEIQSL